MWCGGAGGPRAGDPPEPGSIGRWVSRYVTDISHEIFSHAQLEIKGFTLRLRVMHVSLFGTIWAPLGACLGEYDRILIVCAIF